MLSWNFTKWIDTCIYLCNIFNYFGINYYLTIFIIIYTYCNIIFYLLFSVLMFNCASSCAVGGGKSLLNSVLHLPLAPRRRRRLLSYEMRAWPANTATSTTPMIIQFFIISFYIIANMIEGLLPDNNLDINFWHAACSAHLMCQRLMDTSVMRYVCVFVVCWSLMSTRLVVEISAWPV